MKLSSEETLKLNEALQFLSVPELKDLSGKLGLTTKVTKGQLIKGILFFIQEGTPPKRIEIPEASKAKKGTLYPLKSGALILKGAYKNDLKTRNFMKTLVGDHFHFTAYGIDWINKRWIQGKPPTYQAFADFWEKERRLRQTKPASPKKEWAYINFTQDYLKKIPHATKAEIIEKWKKERLSQKSKAHFLVEKGLKSQSESS